MPTPSSHPGSSQAASARSPPAPTRFRLGARASRVRRWPAEAALVAFTLQGVTIPRGRDRLGLSVRLARDRHGDPPRARAGASVSCARLRGPRLHARPAPRRRPLPTRRSRQAALRGRQPMGHVRRSEAPLRGRKDGRRTRLCAAGFCGARSATAIPRCLEAAWFLGHAAVRASQRCRCSRARASRRGTGNWSLAAVFGAGLLALAFALATGLIQARARVAHLARAPCRAVVPGVEGRGPGARDRQRASTRQLLPADRARLRVSRLTGKPMHGISRGWSASERSILLRVLRRARPSWSCRP